MPSTGETIRALAASGLGRPEIARRLGLARATVDYHLKRAGRTEPGGTAIPSSARARVESIRTRDRVAEMLGIGASRAAVARALGVSKATVSYHARRLGLTVDERCARRYDWSEIQRYYDEGNSVRQCMARFGFSSASWFKAVKRGDVTPRPTATPAEVLFASDTYRGRFHLKSRLLAEGLKENRCERCGINHWRGEPITMALHHVNGVRDDNRLDNLELLCPNCHSQTENFAGRNRARRRLDGGARASPREVC